MNEYSILLPFDSEEVIEQKIEIIKKLIGEKNISYCGDVHKLNIPKITIRCNKKKWKEIKFKLDLAKTYW